MKRFLICIITAGLAFAFTSCQEKNFITDPAQQKAVAADYAARKAQLGGLVDMRETGAGPVEEELLRFLYAYMPLSDIADHETAYFLDNIRSSLRARGEMPWGRVVPEREFLHFVLPVRVNNEDLDNSRPIFYEELRERVGHLSMYDAVLEVNHWCHEKVVYRPSDMRTSSPLASIKTAYGRCGEESTFTVAALRAVGIPARQVYTPRWAHTDDNHAWVEAWVDGRWHFLGACEPEPVLDLAWFNAPASRGMLMHTRVFGHYFGPEEVMRRTPLYTEINVIDNYAPTASASVIVSNPDGTPADSALVEYKIYNYAEYHTVARKLTDNKGQSSLTAGRGDMLVWASKNGRFGFGKLSFGKDEEIHITLNKTADNVLAISEDLEITPPAEDVELPEVTAQERAANNRLLAREDSIRGAYTATFFTEETARAFARDENINPADAAVYLPASRGNHKVICRFLKSYKDEGAELLASLSQKDLRDVTAEVLDDAMTARRGSFGSVIFNQYIRCPRVMNEMLTPCRRFFKEVVTDEQADDYRANPEHLALWVKNNIEVDADCNLGGCPISPRGVWNARRADSRSRDIFFVSMARALDIPARIDEVTGKVQLVTDAGFRDVDFESRRAEQAPQGVLRALYEPTKLLDDPKYYSHFTISRITPSGTIRLLAYDEEEVDMGGGMSYRNFLEKGTALDAGDYMLVTGTRLASGKVLSHISFFRIREDQTTVVPLEMRRSATEVQVIGSFNSESIYLTTDGHPKSILSTTGRGYFLVGIVGVGDEPTNHALRDISIMKDELQSWGRPMLLLFPTAEDYGRFDETEFPNLPENIVYGIDWDGSIREQIAAGMKYRRGGTLPIFVIADTFNRVVFESEGYTIGLGERLDRTIKGL